jgi:hypothetical protein
MNSRIKHQLWKVQNGWLLVPEDSESTLAFNEAPQCVIFKTLKEFSEWKPKRQRRKATPKPQATEPQHTLD